MINFIIILERDIKNITRLITMFEYNKLPYNKHAISVLLDKKNELITKLLDSDNSISLKDITDIHDLRIILSLIRASSVRESSDEYAWLDQFLYSDDFLNHIDFLIHH